MTTATTTATATTPSQPLSSVHLQSILESIEDIQDKNHEPILHGLLFHKIKSNYNLGSLADDEFFHDLTRAMISCRKRAKDRAEVQQRKRENHHNHHDSLHRNVGSGSDSDGDTVPISNIRTSSQRKTNDEQRHSSGRVKSSRPVFLHRRSSPELDSDDDMDVGQQHDSDEEEMEMQRREELAEDMGYMTLKERWNAATATSPSPNMNNNTTSEADVPGSSSSKASGVYSLLNEFELLGKVKAAAKAFETGSTPDPKSPSPSDRNQRGPRTPTPPQSDDDDLDGFDTPRTHASDNMNNMSINFEPEDLFSSGHFNLHNINDNVPVQQQNPRPELPKQRPRHPPMQQPPPPPYPPSAEKYMPTHIHVSNEENRNTKSPFMTNPVKKPSSLSAEKLKPFSFVKPDESKIPFKSFSPSPGGKTPKQKNTSTQLNGTNPSSPFRNVPKQSVSVEDARPSTFGGIRTDIGSGGGGSNSDSDNATMKLQTSTKQSVFTAMEEQTKAPFRNEPVPSENTQQSQPTDDIGGEKVKTASYPSFHDAKASFNANMTKQTESKTGIGNAGYPKIPTSGEKPKTNPFTSFDNKTAFKATVSDQSIDGVSSASFGSSGTTSKSVDNQGQKTSPSSSMNGPPNVSRAHVKPNLFGATSFSSIPTGSPTIKPSAFNSKPFMASKVNVGPFGASSTAPAVEKHSIPNVHNAHVPAAVPAVPPVPSATVNPILNNTTVPQGMAIPTFQVDLSKSSKHSKRASPRSKFRNKKKLNIDTKKVNLPDILDTSTASFSTNGPGVENSSNVSTEVSDMDIDTPRAGDPVTEDVTVSSIPAPGPTVPAPISVNAPEINGLDPFNIGTGSKPATTPGRKGSFANWRVDKMKKVNGAAVPTNGVKPTSNPVPPASPQKSRVYEPVVDLEAEKRKQEKEQKISTLREEAKAQFSAKKYRESVSKYTEAISVSTDDFTKMPDPVKKTAQSESLATLYGNRAAGLMMIGAFSSAAVDCDRALKFLNDYNPLSFDITNDDHVVSFLKVDGGLTLMTKLHARMGRAYVKCGRLNEAEQTFKSTERIATAGIGIHQKIKARAASLGVKVPMESQQQASEKVLNQCLGDAHLFGKDLDRLRSNAGSIQSMGGVRRSVDIPLARQNNPLILPYVNAYLKLSPSDERMQESKVICLASMKRWTELNMFCESLACSNTDLDGIFIGDLKETNNRLSFISPAKYIIQPGLKTAIETGNILMNPKQAAEVVVRLPSVVAKLYIRGLRLEERYDEAEHAIKALVVLSERLRSTLLSPSKKTEKAKLVWCSGEIEKIHKTIREKDQGDRCYRDGDYAQAAEWYASVLKIDTEESNNSYKNPWQMETAGGRLHAVLHCNRAACLMAMKKFDNAAKECTAALKTQPGYMKAMLRRARCYARLHRFVESISEYDRWMNLVREAKSNPNHRSINDCQFDRAANISDSDYQKAVSERSEAIKCKHTMEEKARREKEEAKRKASSAYNREQFYNQNRASGSRPWDSFNGSGPKNSKNRGYNRSSSYTYGHNRSKSSSSSSNNFRGNDYSKSRSSEKAKPSPSSDSVKCYYKILSVSRDATSTEIKKAYHKMALKYHPDKNNSDSAADIFRKVKVAYETLSDDKARRKYDVERVHSSYYSR